MPYSESDLLPLSGLQHLVFCERQWGLIHLEQIWIENRLTAEGRMLHERADSDQREVRGDLIIARSLRIHSLRLGLAGKADVVEFHKDKSDGSIESDLPQSVRLAYAKDFWRPIPVEYKRGRPKRDHCDMVQLCAQALGLEEMLGCAIPLGYLYYGKQRRRQEVRFDELLRQETEALAHRMHDLFNIGTTPPPVYGDKCKNCSLFEVCQPKPLTRRRSVANYLKRSLVP